MVILERESRVAQHQTGHDSGVIHSGVYYAPGSLKARLCVERASLMYAYCEERHIRYGKFIVALEESELPRLDELERRGRANGVPGLRRLTAAEIRDVEPECTGIAALHSPNTGIVNYVEVAQAIARDLQRRNVVVGARARDRRSRGSLRPVALPLINR